MNKSVLSVLAGSLLLSAASCSSDEPNTSYAGEGTTFTVNLPEDLATRVLNAGPTTELGNGFEAKNLFYAIYLQGSSDGPVMQNFDATGYNYVPGSDSSQPIVFADGSLSVTFTRNLVKGKTYEIVFWAQNPNSMGTPYSYDLTSRDLTVNYDDLPSYGQTRDAFYATEEFTNDGNSVSATLYRPFAQINIGTADLETYMTLEKITSPADIAFGMTVTNVANTINLSNNDVTGSETVIAKANPVTANLAYKFPVGNEYDMLATAFVLTPKATSQVCDVTLNIDGDAVANAFQTYTNVPIQGNFRTNIYGNLLTCPTDFLVTKEPAWNTPDYNYSEMGHEAVDLGLPSGVKWATCNIGANNPEDYGNYYAWGETTTKTGYIQANSKWYGKTISEMQTAGVIDDNDNLTSAYDAATANWGDGWRMPTEAECQELIDNCTWTWSTMNGNKGYTVTSKSNGNSIFLPAAGLRINDGLGYAGSCGYCWSSTASSGEKSSYYLYFYSSSQYLSGYSRYYGQSVRPVTE